MRRLAEAAGGGFVGLVLILASLSFVYFETHASPDLRWEESQSIDWQRRYEEGAALFDNLKMTQGPLPAYLARLTHSWFSTGAAWNTARAEQALGWLAPSLVASLGVYWWSFRLDLALAVFAALVAAGRPAIAAGTGASLAPVLVSLLVPLAAWMRHQRVPAASFAAAGLLCGLMLGVQVKLGLALLIPVVVGLFLFSVARRRAPATQAGLLAVSGLPMLLGNPLFLLPHALQSLAAFRLPRPNRRPLALGLPALVCVIFGGILSAAAAAYGALSTGSTAKALVLGWLSSPIQTPRWDHAWMLLVLAPSAVFFLPVFRQNMRVQRQEPASHLHWLKLILSLLVFAAAALLPARFSIPFAVCWTWLTLANAAIWRRRTSEQLARVFLAGWSVWMAWADLSFTAVILPLCCAALDLEHAARALWEERHERNGYRFAPHLAPALALLGTLVLSFAAIGSYREWAQLRPIPFPGADRVRTAPERAADLHWLWQQLDAHCELVSGPAWLAGLLAPTSLDAVTWRPPERRPRVCAVLEGTVTVREPWQSALPEVARHAGFILRAR